ncbi:MAG: hypothetical protein ACREUU_19340, partial [Gammaproteobacteria bacterium]
MSQISRGCRDAYPINQGFEVGQMSRSRKVGYRCFFPAGNRAEWNQTGMPGSSLVRVKRTAT